MAKDTKVILTCTECLSRNYNTTENKSSSKRLELNKFCKKCGKHTLHKATK
ncbi:MAG: 50S ribosomal protein L33 [Erysipelotrichaceae bacterium]|nr:50S ribosomal protein L33 [Erysipelotrichaceae bacterium]